MFSVARLMTLSAVIASVALSGCASFNMTKPAPKQEQAITVKFTAAELSGWSDLPTGTYRVPGSQVIVSGHQKGGAAGLLFGVVGVAVQSSINESVGAEATKSAEAALRITLAAEAQDVTRALVASDRFAGKFTLSDEPSAPVLTVANAVIVTFVNETDVRPYVVLKASLIAPKGAGESWTTRYIASSAKPRPLSGDGSWTADGGAALRKVLSTDLKNAIEVMLKDVSSPYARDDGNLTMVQGYFPYVKTRLQTVGYALGEDDRFIFFVPKLGDVVVFAGVNIMEKALTTYRAATKDDAVFKMIDDSEK